MHVAEQLKNPAVSCIINKDEVVQSAGIGILNPEFGQSVSVDVTVIIDETFIIHSIVKLTVVSAGSYRAEPHGQNMLTRLRCFAAALFKQLCVEFDSLPTLRAQVADLRGKIRALGSVNVSAIEEYKEVKARYDELSRQVTDVEESRNELSRMIAKLSAQMREIFTDSFRAINENFSRVFTELFGGGEASLVLEDESDVLACGIGIRVAPPGKVIKNLEALSGGEQALVAISIYFAILAVNPAPFCILDEIEAALDDANVVRFAQYLRRISDKTQFIVITHRRGTMEAANVLYGVTMQEDGVSKLLKLDLEQVDATLVS